MDLTSERVLLGSAGAGGDSYWINITATSGGLAIPEQIAVDSSQNVAVASTVDIGGTRYPGTFYYDPKGNLLWQTYINSGISNNIGGVAFDASGNICSFSEFGGSQYPTFQSQLVGGSISFQRYNTSVTTTEAEHLLFNSATSNIVGLGKSQNLAFLYNVNSSTGAGSSFYRYSWNSSGTSTAFGGAIDSSGNVYLAGQENRTTSGGGNSPFIMKVDSSGASVSWNYKFTGLSSVSLNSSCAVDSSGNVYTVGGDSSTASNYCIISKLNSSGTLQWSKGIDTGTSFGRGIAVDSNGNVIAVADGSNYMNIFKFDTNGNTIWQRGITTTVYGVNSMDVQVDINGNIYAFGWVNLGSSRYPLIAKIPPDGSLTGNYNLGAFGTVQYATRSYPVTNSGIGLSLLSTSPLSMTTSTSNMGYSLTSPGYSSVTTLL